MDYKSEFITFMAQAGVLTFGDFTAKSGRKTPYFINTGRYNNGFHITRLGGFYADCIRTHFPKLPANTVLFGPAYKGIPIAVATAAAFAGHGINLKYSFNRKEEKDHGEGGSLVGHALTEGDPVLIVEDVITAGTAIREVLPIIQQAKAEILGLVISVNRMERGQGSKTAIEEIKEAFGFDTYPIVTVLDIIECLYNKPVDGRIYIDDILKSRMEEYIKQYCII